MGESVRNRKNTISITVRGESIARKNFWTSAKKGDFDFGRSLTTHSTSFREKFVTILKIRCLIFFEQCTSKDRVRSPYEFVHTEYRVFSGFGIGRRDDDDTIHPSVQRSLRVHCRSHCTKRNENAMQQHIPTNSPRVQKKRGNYCTVDTKHNSKNENDVEEKESSRRKKKQTRCSRRSINRIEIYWRETFFGFPSLVDSRQPQTLASAHTYTHTHKYENLQTNRSI